MSKFTDKIKPNDKFQKHFTPKVMLEPFLLSLWSKLGSRISKKDSIKVEVRNQPTPCYLCTETPMKLNAFFFMLTFSGWLELKTSKHKEQFTIQEIPFK